MPSKCAANLLTFGPVVSIEFECAERSNGWKIKVWHRHWGTSIYECEREEYEGLTLGEASDVLEAVLFTLSEANYGSR